MSPREFSVYHVLWRNAHTISDRLALVDEGGEPAPYAELLQRVDRLAAGMSAVGLSNGDRIAVVARNSAFFFQLYLAAARIGAVLYPFNWRWSTQEVERLAVRARPAALMVDEASYELLGGAASSVPQGRRFFIGASPPQGFVGVDELDKAPGDDPPHARTDNPFAIIATAAVEAIPRGAILSHDNVLASSAQQIATMQLGESDRNLLALPLFHIAGLGNALAILQAGGANVIMSKFDAAAAVELIDRWQVTYLSDFPPILASLLDAAAESGSSLPSLRIVSGLDAPETIEKLHAATTADFWTGFGQTETSGFVTAQRYRDRPGAAGRPSSLARVRLVDDFDRPVVTGEAGEIVVQGPLVFLGYADEDEVTGHTFRNGWHHTGDVGRFDDDGYLHYVARKPEKELIKPGGENVYPAEVEAAIVTLDGVSAACVFGVPHERWGEGIKAVVETAGNALEPQQVIAHVATQIASFKKPHFVVFTDELPRDEAGSIDRVAVKERWTQP